MNWFQEVKGDQTKTPPTQEIIQFCNKNLSLLDMHSNGDQICLAIESLYFDLLENKLLSTNARGGCIVESPRVKSSHVAYYWYAGSLAQNIARCFGAISLCLYEQFMNPFYEEIFIGMPQNVEICYQVYLRLCQILKKAKTAYKNESGSWGSKREIDEDASRYILEQVQKIQHAKAYIENDDCDKLLYDYAEEKYFYATRNI